MIYFRENSIVRRTEPILFKGNILQNSKERLVTDNTLVFLTVKDHTNITHTQLMFTVVYGHFIFTLLTTNLCSLQLLTL